VWVNDSLSGADEIDPKMVRDLNLKLEEQALQTMRGSVTPQRKNAGLSCCICYVLHVTTLQLNKKMFYSLLNIQQQNIYLCLNKWVSTKHVVSGHAIYQPFIPVAYPVIHAPGH